MNMELGFVGIDAWYDGAHGLVERLVVDRFVVSFTVELGFEREEIEFDMLVLMALDVLKSWLELGRLQGGDDGIG